MTQKACRDCHPSVLYRQITYTLICQNSGSCLLTLTASELGEAILGSDRACAHLQSQSISAVQNFLVNRKVDLRKSRNSLVGGEANIELQCAAMVCRICKFASQAILTFVALGMYFR